MTPAAPPDRDVLSVSALTAPVLALTAVSGEVLGAFRLDYAVPVLKQGFDKTQALSFGMVP